LRGAIMTFTTVRSNDDAIVTASAKILAGQCTDMIAISV
jgi:hypothetical protein